MLLIPRARFRANWRGQNLLFVGKRPKTLRALFMERCKHSVYLATPEEVRTRISYNCSLCNPHFDDSFLRPRQEVFSAAAKFHIPDRRTGVFNENDTLRANAHGPDFCPKCGSGLHYDDGKEWLCAECSHRWKGGANVKRKPAKI